MNYFFVCFTNDAILKITVDGAVGGKGEDWLWAVIFVSQKQIEF